MDVTALVIQQIVRMNLCS